MVCALMPTGSKGSRSTRGRRRRRAASTTFRARQLLWPRLQRLRVGELVWGRGLLARRGAVKAGGPG
jgi:hypothetical protein